MRQLDKRGHLDISTQLDIISVSFNKTNMNTLEFWKFGYSSLFKTKIRKFR